MTTNTTGVNFSPAEKAYLESGGAVHPETGKPAEEAAPEKPVETPAEEKTVETADPEKEAAPEESKSEAAPEDGDDSEEVVEVADGTNPDGETRRKMIAFGAYEKQRKAAKALKETTDKMAQQMAYLTGALEQLRGGKAPAADPAQQPQISATPPDYKTKPEDWLKWVNDTVAHAATFTQQQGKATEQQQQMNDLNNAVVAHEQSFIAGDQAAGVEAHPDFYDAVKYVRERHTAELREAGYDAAQIQQILTARAQDLAIRSINAGKNPAERLYAIAKQHGYRKAAPKAAEAVTEAAKVARQADGQQKAKTISTLSGGAEKGLTLDTLANTSQTEFNKLFKDGKVQHLLGIPT